MYNNCIMSNFAIYNSCKKICPNTDQLMVYGWKHCKLDEITAKLKEAGSPIKKVFTGTVGDWYETEAITLEGNLIERIETFPETLRNNCKNGITNLVLENYRRTKQGLPLIPLLFCVDIDGNEYEFNSETITSKDIDLNTKFTNSELRRAYKLCTIQNSELRKIAQATIKFAKVKIQKDNLLALEAILPPWSSPDWQEMWTARMEQSAPQKKNHWRERVQERIKRIDQEFPLKKRKSVCDWRSIAFGAVILASKFMIKTPLFTR